MSLPTPTPADEAEIWTEKQSIHFEQHWLFDGEVLRVSIKRNAYDDQSWARVDVWSPMTRGWNHLCHLWIQRLPCSVLSYIEQLPLPAAKRDLFESSCRRLVGRAIIILGYAAENRDRV